MENFIEMEEILKCLNSISPREYQTSIFKTASEKNTLVILPTGLGKTLIALMLAVERMKKFPEEKILFLAPTKPLAEQHLNYFKKNLPELFGELQLFTGEVKPEERKKIWQAAGIIFSTPQCVANDAKKNLYGLSGVCLLIEDEAHRCIKNYDYTFIAQEYQKQAKHPRILGLTASPGNDLSRIKEICKNLFIEEVELRTRESEDVKVYLKERKFEKILIDFPKEFQEIKILLKKIFDEKIEQLKSRNLLFGPANKITLLQLQKNLARQANSWNWNAMHGMSIAAQAIKISHALELLETQTLASLETYLKKLQKEAAEKKSKGIQTLVKSPEFNTAFISTLHLRAKNIEHPKLALVGEIISKEISANGNSKIIVFTQFRETAKIVEERLRQIPGMRPSIFVGQAAKEGMKGLNQKAQKEIIGKFSDGEINALVATSIAEEGLDIPEVSVVIFYEPIPSAIRKIQREGRTARLKPGKLIMLVTKDTRDVVHHYAASAREKKMYKTLETIKKEMKQTAEKTLIKNPDNKNAEIQKKLE